MNLKILAEYYANFLNKEYTIIAGRRGKKLSFTCSFQREHFHHLLGLHKLIDMPQICKPKNKYMFFKDVQKGKFVELDKSYYYHELESRQICLMRIEKLLQQDVIIRFDKRKAFSTIHAQLLFFEHYNDTYLHLFFNCGQRGLYTPCSLFVNKTTKYILQQEKFKVLEFNCKDLKIR